MMDRINKYINKRDLVTIVIIVVLATISAVIYNFIGSNRISFFKVPIEERLVSDSELFGDDSTGIKEEVQMNDETIEIIADTVKIDTMADMVEEGKTLDNEVSLKETKNIDADHFPAITLEQMKRIVEDNMETFFLVDARRPEDYKKSRIGNAINIFPYSDNESAVIEQVLALPMSKTIIVYCDGGNCDSSHKVGEILQSFGYKFFIFEGGWEKWTD